ncbi:8-amino-7-oxononanoate synthase [Sphingorhabdus sp. Alg239-R122]|uniref:8-amino-7-oxononanoate synthase n=1 Tax=Sphingorhabdus sp. Alg239-R122 TaxID=2305989 RepID=UPI0013DD6AD1|nr:8-amino-7-oxononanoate synthase [Sphingorhabdus sp. Alg239-R122]
MAGFEIFSAHLDALDGESRRRKLSPIAGHDFASNDYLGLSRSADMRAILTDAVARDVPHGSGGSRLLRGNHAEHEALEEFAAEYYGNEAALYFASGYAANSALFSTLPQKSDIVLYDERIHASVHEGMRLSRAQGQSVQHNDVQAFSDAIAVYRGAGGLGRIWLAVESLYSMDGDRAPLPELAALARIHDAMLVIDEAHATGVFGEGGRGLSHALLDRENLVVLRTCGKALGAEGGLLCLPAILRDFMVNRARGFIFSTAPSPLMAALAHGAIRYVEANPQLTQRLHALVAHAELRLGRYCPDTRRGSQIFPVIIGDNDRTMNIANALQADGFDVRGIRPPTVAPGTARLRISISLNVDMDKVDALADRLDILLGNDATQGSHV